MRQTSGRRTMPAMDESSLEEVLDRLADAVLVLSQAGATRYANATAAKFFARPQRDLIGRSFGLPAIVGETTELDILRGDGASLPVEMRASSIEYRGEACVLASLRDISERRVAQRALEESEQRFRSAFESAGHGIGLLGLDGRWIEVNVAQCHMVSAAAEHLIGEHFSALIHQDDLAGYAEQFARLSTGDDWEGQLELRLTNKLGDSIPVFFSAGLVRDEDSEPLYVVTQMIDIGEWRAAEEQLRQSQKMEMVGQLTGGIAHDFNNILGIVQGNLQLIQRRIAADPRMSEQVGRALNATRRGAELTKRLLAFSRRQVLAPQVLDLGELVTELMTLLQRTLGSDIEVAVELKGGLPSVRIDAAQMENAIINLCVNSRDAMPEGGHLMIETDLICFDREYRDEYSYISAGEYVVLSISDTGGGMPEDVHRHIFEPFFTTKEVGKGTGLGMSMVYGFVKQSEGYIHIYSELGVGTVVRIYLPACREAASKYERTDVPENLMPTGTERILLVEDDADLRATLVSMLEMLGYQVVQANDGATALKVMEDGGIDLLLTDVMMPGGISGAALVNRVRRQHPDIPVLIQSGFAGRGNLLEGVTLNDRTGFVAKPCSQEALAKKLREVLRAPSP